MKLLTIVNTEAGRYLLGTLGKKPEYPIVKITENAFIEHIEKDLYRGTFYSRSPIKNLFQPIVDKISIANEYKRIEDKYKAFLHYSNLERKSSIFPAIYLSTTVTINSETGGLGSTTDGYAGRASVDEAFTTINPGAGNDSSVSNLTDAYGVYASTTSNQFQHVYRFIGTYATGIIGAGSTLNSASLGFYINSKTNGVGSPEFHVVAATPASDGTLVNADYGQTGNTTFGSLAYAGVTATAYNDITLNASGLVNINKTTNSRFGRKTNWEIDNSFGGVWSSGASSIFDSDNTDGTNKPRLIVTYTRQENSYAFFM